KADGTFSGGASGKWQQQDGTLLLAFDAGPAKYAGTVDGNIGSGAMSTYTGLDGCWYLSKQGTVGLTLPSASAVPGMVNAAGTPVGAEALAEGRVPDATGVTG